MKIAIVHNEPLKGMKDSEDVLEEVHMVRQSLEANGNEVRTFPISVLDDGMFFRDIALYRPELVFNLVEEMRGSSRLLSTAAAIFEAMGYPYTGSPFDSLVVTTDKYLSKCVLIAEGILTPEFALSGWNGSGPEMEFPVILKPAAEHASLGIDDGSVAQDAVELDRALTRSHEAGLGGAMMIEHYIEGREINVSLLELPDGDVEVLPIAEIIFKDWPSGKPRIVNYSAKWESGSFEYHNTPRRFDPPGLDLDEVAEVALDCWAAFRLKGYARVDIRVNEDGDIYVIEVNSNPCLSPDAGFMAACMQAGHTVDDAIGRIIYAATP